MLHGDPDGIHEYLVNRCDSTMDLAWSLVHGDAFSEYSWVAALDQLRGRGQLGRRWDRGQGNLYVSLGLPVFNENADTLFPLALGLLLVQALKKHGICAELKWPNDILVGRRKAGGILIERRGTKIVAGIGFNLASQPISSGEGVYPIPACSLSDHGVDVDAPGLWHCSIAHIRACLEGLMAMPENIIEQVEQILAFKGENVLWEQGDGDHHPVRIKGLNSVGELEIQTAHGTRILDRGRIIPRIEI
ncbi:MAG: biotin--[acetyl-CoA-carboxylase] ligase [Desulfobacterales bacterium]|nr:biotin--[acetyl-CoA-carboxylase] ligase [Desulfobacterales bacterium]